MRIRESLFVVLIVGAICAGTQAAPGDLLFEFQKPNHAGRDRFARLGEGLF